MEFGRRFGEVAVHPFLPKLEEYPEVTLIEPDKGGKADEWHIDVSFSPNPPIASLLHLVTCPRRSRRCSKGSPPFTHPVTGRRSLYVTRMWTSHIPQLSRQESDAVLQHLFEHSEQPSHTCRYRVVVSGDLPTSDTPRKPDYERNGDERYYPRRVNARVGYRARARARRTPAHRAGVTPTTHPAGGPIAPARAPQALWDAGPLINDDQGRGIVIKHKRALSGALTLAVTLGVTAAALPGNATAAAVASTHAADGASVGRAAAGDDGRLREILRRLASDDGAPGALLEMRDRRGGAVLTEGVANVKSQAPLHRDSRFRIGSVTKMFTATVMLQLAGQHLVDLDAPVERYLPGVVRGHGNDGRAITIRQLLQHTSGLRDFLEFYGPEEILKDPMAHHDPLDLVNIALAHPPYFEPGTDWSYSNTGYLLAGMVIEKVTGSPYGDEIKRRIIEPLGLRETSVPVDDSAIPGPHPRGYVRPGDDAPLRDITRVNPSAGGAAGGMISSGTDLNRFLRALMSGKLLHRAQLKEMMTTRSTGGPDGREYGLGLASKPLPCGGRYWGHTGDFLGFETIAGTTVDGRRATAMVNLGPGGSQAQSDDLRAAVETALCKARPSDSE